MDSSALGVVLRAPRLPITDGFNRADSVLTLGMAETGQPWLIDQGTWGISSNRAYAASDANGDVTYVNDGGPDVVVRCTVSGDYDTTGSNFSVPAIVLRRIDANNLLFLRISDGRFRVNKVDGGGVSQLTSGVTSLTDGADVATTVVLRAATVECYSGSTLVVAHTLTGGDVKYAAAYARGYGLYLIKGGTPSFNARWDDFRVERG